MKRSLPLSACRRLCMFLCCTLTGCIIPLGGPKPITRITPDGRQQAIDPRKLWPKLLDVGMDRTTVRANLAGLEYRTDAWPSVGITFDHYHIRMRNPELYIAAWEGAHTWGIHDYPSSYSVTIYYDLLSEKVRGWRINGDGNFDQYVQP